MRTVNQSSNPKVSAASSKARTWTALIMLSVVTLLTFANSWPDALVFDDKGFVGSEPSIPIDSISEAFTDDLWRQDSGGGLYRPLLKVGFEIQNELFGDWKAGYHLVNVFLHLAATLLLFGFIRFLLTFSGRQVERLNLVALLSTLIFAVHPVHTEVVNSVFNSSSIFVSIFAISGLWWLLSHLESNRVKAWAGLALCYSLAILYKESALVIPGIAVAMIILLTRGSFGERVRRMLPVFWLLIPIGVYFWARAYALAPDSITSSESSGLPPEFTAMFNVVSVASEHSWIGKLTLFGQGIKVLIWPYPLQLYYARPIGLEAFLYLALQAVLAASALYLVWKRRPLMAAGLAFFYIALAPSARIISMDGSYPHLAERYLYFPSIGFTIILAVAFQYLVVKLGAKKVTFATLPILVLLAALCWERNSEWASEVNLFETEYQQGHRGLKTLSLLVSSHNKEERFDRVVQICDENMDQIAGAVRLVNTCAVAYSKLQRMDDAIAAFELLAGQENSWIDARLSLVSIYIAQGNRQKAADQYVDIINRVEEPERKELYKGDLLVSLFPKNRERLMMAKQHYQVALKLKPGWEAAEDRLTQLEKMISSIEGGPGQE